MNEERLIMIGLIIAAIVIFIIGIFIGGNINKEPEVKECPVPEVKECKEVICPGPEIITRNVTIYKEVNTTCQGSYVLGLIKQIKRCEANQENYWNSSICYYDLNQSNIELRQCKEEMCDEYNSSWC